MSTANSVRRTDSICRTVVQLIFYTFLGFTVYRVVDMEIP